MGKLHWEQAETEEVINSLVQQTEKLKPMISLLSQSITNFQTKVGDNSVLAGIANSKMSISLTAYIIPVLRAFRDFNERLTQKIAIFNRTESKLRSQGSVLDEETLESTLDELSEIEIKLQTLREAQSFTSNLFTEELAIIEVLSEALEAIGSYQISSDGSLLIVDQTNWLEKLKFYSEVNLERFLDLLDCSEDNFRELVRKILADLRSDGWAAASLQRFVKIINAQLFSLNKLQNAARQVGSQVFLDLWSAWQCSDSKSAQDKLRLLLKIIQLPLDLPQSPALVAELISHFDHSLDPANEFWDDLSKTVQLAFANGNISDYKELGKQIHNLRYVISAQQAQYIRDSDPGNKTDGEKLALYLTKHDYTTEESDRLHQKGYYNGKFMQYPAGYANGDIKVVVNFHSEFILNSEGRFQNEIDPEGASENGIVNGASFNYADNNDRDKAKTHKRLDVEYADFDPAWRDYTINKSLKDKNNPVRYVSPTNFHPLLKTAKVGSEWNRSYQNPDGYYQINGLSSEQNSKRLRAEFNNLVETLRQKKKGS
ncbi:DUF3114 domain-containing protein [Xylocopilactobacillus apicola]|uniref:LXG domain-containing protein n=1 Tax=Xylocopilactobacillus apicola TaxID=2932184 RepID=A0AAU9DEU0_9LACO|nr:DUF3114 domain-containing protein [Xylocopilactobacillus apicola]BDR59402.1 hypothetical protein XA3_18430 [Xylocopilactobacillus apicola]